MVVGKTQFLGCSRTNGTAFCVRLASSDPVAENLRKIALAFVRAVW